MTPAGWYPDPDEPGMLRWWNGEQWTEHRQPPVDQPAPAPSAADEEVFVHVRVGKHERTDLVATFDRVTIHGETFALAELDGVQHTAVRSRLNG